MLKSDRNGSDVNERQLRRAIMEGRCKKVIVSPNQHGFTMSAELTDWPTPIPVSGTTRVIRIYRTERDAFNVVQLSAKDNEHFQTLIGNY